MKKIKISELPESSNFNGLYTIGTDKNNRSVKVSLEVVAETKAEVEALEELPFCLIKNGGSFRMAENVVYTDWHTGYFYDNQYNPCGKPYNIIGLDGNPHANPNRIFRCGQQRYRHTGLQLVNIEIERNPHIRFVDRCPTQNAHPGIVYKNTGRIRIKGEFDGNIGTMNRILHFSLDGLYIYNYYDNLIPMSERPIVLGANEGIDKQTANQVHPTITGGVYSVAYPQSFSEQRISSTAVYITHPFDEKEYRGISCRYDAAGNKIFYPVKCPPIMNKLSAPTLNEFMNVVEEIGTSSSDSQHKNYITLSATGAGATKYEIQIWAKRKHAYLVDGFDERLCSLQYRWRYFKKRRGYEKEKPKILRLVGRTALIRVRKVRNNSKSAWSYFRVNFKNSSIADAKKKLQV